MTNTMPPPHIGRVALAVADIERSIDFYTDVIGLTLLAREGDDAQMGAGTEPLLLLHGQAGLSRVRRATGLYHFALLLPSRADLGDALQHYVEVNAPISGFADHAVSEAIYLTDPDGHGIEVYRDRPREEWAFANGQLRMTTDPIDFDGVLKSRSGAWQGLPPGTMMGHIHLQVAQIEATERFYIDHIGFDLIIRYGPSATFLAANGYHHHLGANVWAGAGLPPAPEDAARLLWYEIRQPDAATIDAIAARLDTAGYAHERDTTGLRVVDPSGIQLLLTAH
jgi:catechol 2,3-dioxygenase